MSESVGETELAGEPLQSKVRFIRCHPYLSQLLFSFLAGFVVVLVQLTGSLMQSGWPSHSSSAAEAVLLFVLLPVAYAWLIYPLVILGYEVLLLCRALRGRKLHESMPFYDLWVLAVLAFSELVLLNIKEVRLDASWQMQLRNSEIHSPIYPLAYPLVAMVLILCVAGLCVLWFKPVNELPPLLSVLAIGGAYLGVIFSVIWDVQVVKLPSLNELYRVPWQKLDTLGTNFYLTLPTMVLVLIVIKTVAVAVRAYEVDPQRSSKVDTVPLLGAINRFLQNSKRWPIAGFVVVLPLLAVCLMVMLLFGQAPNIVIKTFTETSDWNLSQKTSPPNVFFDEHYLCTAAAGGHESLVRPIRRGVRHGHEVIVNRQLLIANAFEQVIEERTPRAHRLIRGFYDRYGFPLARLITSKWAADITWLLMKPLEWVFVVVVYLVDVHPEDRIAMQYTGKAISDLKG